MSLLSILVKLNLRAWTDWQRSSCYNCSALSLWLLMSRVRGLGTSSSSRGNRAGSMSFRQKQRDFAFDPMIPFLISISSLLLLYFSRASCRSFSSLSFFCYQPCSSSVSPSIFSSNSDILMTLSLTSFLLLIISLSLISSIFLDCSTSPSSLILSLATSAEAWQRLQKDSSWWESAWRVSALYMLFCRWTQLSMSLTMTLIMLLISVATLSHISRVVSLYHLQLSPFSTIRPSRLLMISVSLMVSSSIRLGSFLIAFVSDFLMSFSVSSMMVLLAFRYRYSSLCIMPSDSLTKQVILSLKGAAMLWNCSQVFLMTVSWAIFSLIRISLSLSILLQECTSARFDSSYMNCEGWMSRCSRRQFSQMSRLAHLEQVHMQAQIFLWVSHSVLMSPPRDMQLKYLLEYIMQDSCSAFGSIIQMMFFLLLALNLALSLVSASTSASPVFISSATFKAGALTFVFISSSATTQSATVTYPTALASSSLKVPTLGITQTQYSISGSALKLQVYLQSFRQSDFTYACRVNTNSNLRSLQLTYLAVDTSFTPPFSMNRFFPRFGATGPRSKQYYVNFTRSTGVTLDTAHQNVLLPFLHYVDAQTYDGTIDIGLNFSLLNGSYYTVIVSTTSNMYLNYAGFSRLIFDKTLIESMGEHYFDYGIENGTTTCGMTIPPTIQPDNFFYGIHSFSSNSPSQYHFDSTYNITTGVTSLSAQSGFNPHFIAMSYMHHKFRTCPSGYPYYNISERLCYDVCAERWHGNSNFECTACAWDCYNCTNTSDCTSCNATTDFRQLASGRCQPISGYYDDGTNNVTASPCTPPCLTCQNSGSNCTSCVTSYYLSGNTCNLCSNAIPDCLQCTNSSICTRCPDNSTGPSCTVCNSTQYVSGFTCADCSTAITNCQTCTDATTCTLCQTSFTLFSATNCSCVGTEYLMSSTCHTCSAAITYCQSCSDNLTCTSCLSTFTLASPTSCVCNGTSYLNTTSSSCIECVNLVAYCDTCTNTTCNTCLSNFTLTNGSCVCPTGFYADSATPTCASCSAAISNCVECSSSTVCTLCGSGFRVNTTTNLCDVEPCQITNCNTCDSSNYSLCIACDSGYSLSSPTTCTLACGDDALHSSQACDDGNTVSGDGCSSTCSLQSGFSCQPQIRNLTNSYSHCYYTGSISFELVWIRKIEGENTLKFMFSLHQQIDEWDNVNWTEITQFDFVDSTTNFSTGTGKDISLQLEGYRQIHNRFSISIPYDLDMQEQYVSFELLPFRGGIYPAFTAPTSIQFFPPYIRQVVKVVANNNQNSQVYSQSIYGAYGASRATTWALLCMAAVVSGLSLLVRVGKVLVVEMLMVLQVTYFSLAFLDSMNPVFSGLLPLRYVTTILPVHHVQAFLDQGETSPNAMKGIYMFLNLKDNFQWTALTIYAIIVFGVILLALHYFINWAFPITELDDSTYDRRCYWLYHTGLHCIGELPLFLLIVSLPLLTVSLAFQILYTMDQSADIVSYSQATGLFLTVLIYCISLQKLKHPTDPSERTSMGEFFKQLRPDASCFTTLKFVNYHIILITCISAMVMLTIYADTKLFATLCIIFIMLIDIVVVAINKPYKFGFVSCFKGEQNKTQTLFEKIELYRIYQEKPPEAIRISEPDSESDEKSSQNSSQNGVFTQHFRSRVNLVKTAHQGLIVEGEVLNQSKLFLFNQNFRRIFNDVTLIVVELIFACTSIYHEQINKNYDSVTVRVALPMVIHSVLFLNVLYNCFLFILHLCNRTRDRLGRVDNEFQESASQLVKSIYSIPKPGDPTPAGSQKSNKPAPTNKDIFKGSGPLKSMYDIKRAEIHQTFKSTLKRV